MASLHDLIGSIIIGGIVLLMLLTFNGNVLQSAGVQTFNTTVQSNLTSVTEILEYDFRKIGYRVPLSIDNAIVAGDSSSITLKGDFDNNGTLDVISYGVTKTKAVGSTNPKARILWRKVNAAPADSFNVGITRFNLQYIDTQKNVYSNSITAIAGKISAIRISVAVEGKEHFLERKTQYLTDALNDTLYVGAYWERTIKPKNMR